MAIQVIAFAFDIFFDNQTINVLILNDLNVLLYNYHSVWAEWHYY